MRSIFELYDSEKAVNQAIDTSINRHINSRMGERLDLNKITQLKPSITVDDKCDRMFPWQKQLSDMLRNPNTDHYVLSLPGSGKTLPIICHWGQIINIENLNNNQPARLDFLNNPGNIPKLLWLTPIQNLNVNIKNDIEKIFINIIIQIIENDFNISEA
jgi:hypothetical protein